MAGSVIPLTPDPLFEQITTLDGTDYLLTFAYNERDGFWYLDVADQDGDPIALALKCVVDWNMLRRCTDPRKPAGILAFDDITSAGIDPGFDDLGLRVQLVYFTADEVAAGA